MVAPSLTTPYSILVCLAMSSAESTGESILSTVRKAAKLAVYDDMMMSVKNHQIPPMILVDRALGISSEPVLSCRLSEKERVKYIRINLPMLNHSLCWSRRYHPAPQVPTAVIKFQGDNNLKTSLWSEISELTWNQSSAAVAGETYPRCGCEFRFNNHPKTIQHKRLDKSTLGNKDYLIIFKIKI